MSEDFPSETPSWLDTGLAAARLQQIGIITVIWNSIEFDLQELIIALLQIHPEIGFFITADLQNVSRYQLAKNMIKRDIQDDRLKSDVLRAIEFFDQCRIRRNAVVHAMPVYDEEKKELSGRMAKIDARTGGGELRFGHFRLTAEYLTHMVQDFWCCRMVLTDAFRKVRRLHRYERDEDARRGETFEKYVFDYSSVPLDTAWIQTRLDQLRSVHPNQDIQPPPPPPSRA